MSVYYSGCATSITPPVCTDCPPKELGGIRSIWLQKSSYTFLDITDPAEWAAAVASGDIYIFPKTRGSLEVAETTSAGFGDNMVSIDGYEFTLNGVDPILENCPTWKDLRGNLGFLVGYRTQTKVWLSDKTVAISPMIPIQDDIKSGVFPTIKMVWAQEDPICPVDMPVGVFEQCFGVTP
jgi:hypothetical protein